MHVIYDYYCPTLFNVHDSDIICDLILFRKFLEDVLLDIISVQHNEELVTLELVAHITPVLMPSFSIPIKSHLHFEEDGEHQRIYK